jgi:hypothetical protein
MGWFNDLIVRIKGDSTHLDATLSKTKAKISGWAAGVGALIAGAFAVASVAILKFSKEAMFAAAEVEGIKSAFARLGAEGTTVLENMKRATRGVIAEDELMRLALRAKDLGIPFRDLGTYMTFATNQAIRLGKPVQAFADLMINSVGRGSARGMYQMGIATNVATAAFKEQGGMIRVVTDMLDEMGTVADTTAVKMSKFATSGHELQQAWGTWLNKSETIGAIRQYFTDIFTAWADERLTFWQKIQGSPDDYKKFLAQEEEKQRAAQGKNLNTPEYWTGVDKFLADNATPIVETKKTIGDLREEIQLAKQDLDLLYDNDLSGAWEQVRVIAALEEKLKKLTTLPIAKHGTESLINVSGGMTPAMGGIDLSPLKDIKGVLSTERNIVSTELTEWQTMWQEAKINMVDSAADMVEGLFTAISSGNWDDFGKELLMGFANFLSMLGKQMIALAMAESAFMKALANPEMWPLALAAGIAAVAIAGLIRGTISQGSQSFSSGGGGGSSYGSSNGAGELRVVVEGKIQGRDIYISNRRYSDEIKRNT